VNIDLDEAARQRRRADVLEQTRRRLREKYLGALRLAETRRAERDDVWALFGRLNLTLMDTQRQLMRALDERDDARREAERLRRQLAEGEGVAP
jgi:imidazolonepropionase-like amidohydrolase